MRFRDSAYDLVKIGLQQLDSIRRNTGGYLVGCARKQKVPYMLKFLKFCSYYSNRPCGLLINYFFNLFELSGNYFTRSFVRAKFHRICVYSQKTKVTLLTLFDNRKHHLFSCYSYILVCKFKNCF